VRASPARERSKARSAGLPASRLQTVPTGTRPGRVCLNRAHPSGYFIDHPAPLRNTRKTWLSGMSPVAAAFASACRAPDDGAALVVAGGAVVAAGVTVAVVDVVAEELPQPASKRGQVRRVKAASARERLTRSCSRGRTERRLNGSGAQAGPMAEQREGDLEAKRRPGHGRVVLDASDSRGDPARSRTGPGARAATVELRSGVVQPSPGVR
jgi:hypothetical protein